MIPAERFSNRVNDYVSGRPGYPDEVVLWLAETFGLERSASIADVGAGTGISSGLFLRHGFTVFDNVQILNRDGLRALALVVVRTRRRPSEARADAHRTRGAVSGAPTPRQRVHGLRATSVRFRSEGMIPAQPGGDLGLEITHAV